MHGKQLSKRSKYTNYKLFIMVWYLFRCFILLPHFMRKAGLDTDNFVRVTVMQ